MECVTGTQNLIIQNPRNDQQSRVLLHLRSQKESTTSLLQEPQRTLCLLKLILMNDVSKH